MSEFMQFYLFTSSHDDTLKPSLITLSILVGHYKMPAVIVSLYRFLLQSAL